MLNSRKLTLSQLLGSQRNLESRSEDLFSTTVENSPRVHEFFWRIGNEVDSLPLAVIPYKGDVETFFADVATYYPQMSPITAYMHVLDKDLGIDANDLIVDHDRSKPSQWQHSSLHKDLQRRVWIALIVAEAATSSFSNNRNEDAEIGYPLCRRSLCFALARAALLYPAHPRKRVASRWMELRDLTKMESSPELMASILWLTSIAFDESPPSVSDAKAPELVQAVREVVSGGLLSSRFAELLARKYPGVSELLPILAGDFDKRMSALTGTIDLVRNQSQGSEIDALTIAFFCNGILPGSFTYARYLSRLLTGYPSIIMWYGLFCGLSDEFDIGGVASGTGQKLLRDIEASFNLESRPMADIALEELVVLARTGLKSSTIKPVQQRVMLVSLLPGVESFARFPGREDGPAHQAPHATAYEDDRNRQIADRDEQLRQLLSQAQKLLLQTPYSGRMPSLATERSIRRKRPGTKKDDQF